MTDLLMTALDKRLRPRALDMIKERGKTLTYVQTIVEAGAYDTETSEYTPDKVVENTYNVKGLLSKVSYGDITSGIATALDSKITIAGLSIDNPMNGDVINGKYFVKYVNPVYSGELVAYYELICESR
jgi:hypothetical protein